MHIVHLLENLNLGGAERVVVDLVSEQVRRGDHCSVICLFERGALADELERIGVTVRALEKPSGPSPITALRLRRILRDGRADVLHTHNAMAHYYGVFSSIGLPLCRVNTRHGMGTLLGNRRQQWLYRLAMTMTDQACFVCDAARQRFVKDRLISADKATTVYNGIDTGRYRHGGRPGLLRQLIGVDGSARLLVTVGRLNPAKNHPLLISAFAKLADENPDLHLVIIGDGAGMSMLQRLRLQSGLAERIHLPGARSDVPALLADAATFVLSSQTEGFSLSLLEAGAAGLPVVATDVGGNGEIIADRVRGRLVAAGDVDALAAAINELLQSDLRSKHYVAALSDWVEQHCTVAAMTKAYAQVYAEAAK